MVECVFHFHTHTYTCIHIYIILLVFCDCFFNFVKFLIKCQSQNTVNDILIFETSQCVYILEHSFPITQISLKPWKRSLASSIRQWYFRPRNTSFSYSMLQWQDTPRVSSIPSLRHNMNFLIIYVNECSVFKSCKKKYHKVSVHYNLFGHINWVNKESC